MIFYDKALIEGKSDLKWYPGRIAAGWEMFVRLKNIFMESDLSPIYRSVFYEKVYTMLHLGSKASLLMTHIAWELHINFVALAEPHCSLNMTVDQKKLALEYNRKANDFFSVTEHMLEKDNLPANKIASIRM